MNQIRVGAMLSYISIFLTFIVGLVYTPILIRILGQSNYGLYSLILAMASYLSLLDLGVGNAIVRYIARNKAIGDSKKESQLIGQFLKFFTGIGILALFLGSILSFKLPEIFNSSLSRSEIDTAQVMILILTINFALSFPLNVFSAVLQANEKFIFLRGSSIVRIVVIPILTLVALYLDGHLVAMTVVTSSVNIMILLAGYIYCKKVLRIKISFIPIEKEYKKEIFIYSFFIFLTALADKLYWQTDQILLGILENPEAVAIYAISIQIVMIFMSLSTAISGLFLPKVSKIVTEQDHILTLNLLFINVSRVQFFILALAFSGFILFGKEFIVYWAGDSYELAYTLIIILMIPFFVDLIQNIGLVILQAKGLYKFRTITLLISSILNIIISIPIINHYGSIGTAVVTSIFVALGNVILLNWYYHFKLRLDIKLYWTNIGRIMIPLLIMTVVIYLIKSKFYLDSIELFISILIYTVTYMFVIYFFGFNDREKQFFKNVVSLIKKLS